MNKINDLPNPTRLKTTNQNINSNQTSPPVPKPFQPQNIMAKNSQLNTQNKNQNTINTVNKANNVNNIQNNY